MGVWGAAGKILFLFFRRFFAVGEVCSREYT